MRRTRKTGSIVERLLLAVFVLGILPVVGASRSPDPAPAGVEDSDSVSLAAAENAGFAVRYRGITARSRVTSLTVLPGESVSLEVLDGNGMSGPVPSAPSGRLVGSDQGRWKWTAPEKPG